MILDLGAAYTFFGTAYGTAGFSDLIRCYLTWWIISNAGLTLEYVNGDTPIAEERIDLLSLGLELKY